MTLRHANAMSQSSATAATLPARIGRFEVRAPLGAGAFAAVYRAFDPHLQREVALKLPHPGTLAEPGLRERFLREARTAAGLRHPHILPVFDAGEADGRLYLATAFASGGTLAEKIRGDQIDLRGAARIVRDLAGALAYAHAEGVVHRDVKPDNVLLDADGTAYLADFGLAFRQEAADRLTHDGDVLGTPAYIAPEQARAVAGEPLPASDQYSLGAVLYELLTGRPPFTGDATSVLARVLAEDPLPPRRLRRRIPRDLETICLKCLAKRPQDRYPDCGVLAEDLRRWLDGEPIRARRLGVGERLVRWCRREPRLAGAVLATALALVAAAVAPVVASAWLAAALRQEEAAQDLAARQAARAREQAEEADRQRRRAAEAAKEAEQAVRDAGKAAEEARAGTRKAGEDAARARQEASRAAERLRGMARYRYVAEINLLARAVADGDRAEANRLLDRARDAAGGEAACGFEWRYFGGRTRLIPEQILFPFAVEHLSIRNAFFQAAGFSPSGNTGQLDLMGGNPKGEGWLWIRQFTSDAEKREAAWQRVSPDGLQAIVTEGTTRARWYRQQADVRLTGFTRSVSAVAFTNGGDVLATAHGPEEVRLWRRTGPTAEGAPLPVKGVDSLAFSPDGKVLAAFSDRVRLWDVDKGKELPTEIRTGIPRPGEVQFSPDGKTLAVAGPRKVELFEAGSGKLLGECPDVVRLLQFSPDSKRLAVRDNLNEIQILDVTNGAKVLLRLPAVSGWVRDAVFTPDGRFLVLATERGRGVRVVNSRSGQRRAEFGYDREEAPVVAFAADGRKLLVGQGDTVTVHDAAEWERPYFVEGLADAVTSLAVVDKATMAVPDRSDVLLLDLTTGEERGRLPHRQGEAVIPLADNRRFRVGDGAAALALAVSADGKHVAAARPDGSLQVWDVATGRQRLSQPPQPQAGVLSALAFGPGAAPDLFVGDASGLVRRLDANDGKERGHFTGLASKVYALAVSPDGKCLAGAGQDGDVHLWNLEDGKERAVLKGHGGPVRALTFSPDGKTLVSGGDDKMIRLWEPVTAQELAALPGHTRAVLALAFTPDGRLLLSGGVDRTIRWWYGE